MTTPLDDLLAAVEAHIDAPDSTTRDRLRAAAQRVKDEMDAETLLVMSRERFNALVQGATEAVARGARRQAAADALAPILPFLRRVEWADERGGFPACYHCGAHDRDGSDGHLDGCIYSAAPLRTALDRTQ